MVLLLEFRIPMPMTVEEYHVGQLFSLIEASRENTKGDTGVEIIANEPFDNEHGSGQYTHKVYHLGNKVPTIVAALLPSSSLMLVEKAWNIYPHCRTEFTNPFLKERFSVVVESRHLPDAGTTENAFYLGERELQNRRIIWIDIAGDQIKDIPPEREPSRFYSERTGRGRLQGRWWETAQPVMCAYKLVTIKFQALILQSRIEEIIQRNQQELLCKFHKEIFCYIDKWYGLSMADIRMLEEDIKRELTQKLLQLNLPSSTIAVNREHESIKSTPI